MEPGQHLVNQQQPEEVQEVLQSDTTGMTHPALIKCSMQQQQKQQQKLPPVNRRSSPTLSNLRRTTPAAAAAGRASYPVPANWRHNSSGVDTEGSCPPAGLLCAFPVDLGPLSHSLDSLDTLLMDTSCCYSDEALEELALETNLAAASSSGGGLVDGMQQQVLQGSVVQGGHAGVGGGDGGGCDVGSAGDDTPGVGECVLDLQDLLAIVLDVMNDKRAADKR